MKSLPVIAAALFLVAQNLSAQTITTWISDGSVDESWTTAANWTNGVPVGISPFSHVQVGANALEAMGVDGDQTALTFTFNSDAPATPVIGIGPSSLTLNGGILNSSGTAQNFQVTVIAGANATYTGTSAGLFLDDLRVGTQTISTSGSINIGFVSFTINSFASYGSIGSISLYGPQEIVLQWGSFVPVTTGTFDFTSGNFTGSNVLYQLPTLSGGLSFNTSNFLSAGVLSVVPEPSYLLPLGGCLVALLAFRRRPRVGHAPS